MKAREDKNAAGFRPILRWWTAVICAILAVCVLSLFLNHPNSGSATVLTDRSAFENRVSRALDLLPAGLRNFLRKVKGKLVGPAKLVLVDVFVIRFPAPPSINGAKELHVRGEAPNVRMLAVPATNSDEFRNVLRQLKGAHILSSQQMSAFSGQLAQLSSFANPMPGIYQGHSVEVLPRARQGAIDVAVHAEALTPMMSESNGKMTGTVTNVLASVRAELAPNTGVLVLPTASSGSSTGIFVLPTMFRLKQ